MLECCPPGLFPAAGCALCPFSLELQNSYLVLLVFHLLRPAALTVGGCALELVRLCDILTFLVALLILFFPFLLVGG